MRILKTRFFAKEAEDHGLSDESLSKAIQEVVGGLVDAELGGNLYKKRIAIGSKGKSGGLRSLLVYKASKEIIFCVYLFSKKESDNISQKQLQQLKLLAKALLTMNDEDLKKAIKNEEIQEVILSEESKKNSTRKKDGK